MSDEPNLPPRLRPRRLLRPPFMLAFCFVFGLGVGMVFDRWTLGAFLPSDAMSNFHLIASAWNIIERHYVDRSAVTPQNLTYGAIAGMVDALGDTGHSTFLPPKMVKQLHNAEQGELKGVGLEVQARNRQVVIVAPIDGSPAQRAGLRSGEIILSVNGHDIAGLTLNQAVEQIAGRVGTPVELGILNPQTKRVRDVTLVRAEIKIHDVTWEQLPGTQIADVRIAGFDDDMSDDLRSDLRAIQRQKLQGIVLDLRDNPGGVLDEAIVVASQFLASGNVLLIKDASGQTKPVPIVPGGLATNLPMAILINQGSASAAEIVAGALRDANRGELIGETTFGTGTVLNEFPLPGGSSILLAVEEWLTPSGESFWHKGITPQMEVGLTTNAIPLVPAALEGMSPEEMQASKDDQLLQGLIWVEEQVKTNSVGR
ncbi:MAG TPA: S41 family peptidase [Candidatus Acidoferrum sp.]|jgi:carboxyl-terminal processing protease|nr:S41 family peptidase [Candidatus Acidoferrum sp.]